MAVEIAANHRQPGAGGGGQVTLFGKVLQPADHPGAHPAQQPHSKPRRNGGASTSPPPEAAACLL